jgi:hypothetical protein
MSDYKLKIQNRSTGVARVSYGVQVVRLLLPIFSYILIDLQY